MDQTHTAWRPTPGLTSSACAGVVLVCANLITPLPWPFWAAWGTLTAIAVVQAARR